jgi:2-keto-4-pentenoate hydratase/2-oxohepta-3-ene-1,7-dioic acid hydratase in catechol pathway
VNRIFCGHEAYEPSKIVCVGRNFIEHAKEMGDAIAPSDPVVFLKPNSSISFQPLEVDIPASLGLLHHEVELCALLAGEGRNLSEDEADRLICGYGVGVDFTLRDLQAEAKRKGAPWALSKGFDAAAILGQFLTSEKAGDMRDRGMSLSINSESRQAGRTSEMLFSPARIISFVSRFMTIAQGDVVMCGTPAGVGKVKDSDRVVAAIEGLPELNFVVRRV